MREGYKDLKQSSVNANQSTAMDVIRQYLGRMPLIIGCLALSLGAGWFYIRQKVPKFTATTKILVKNDNKQNSQGSNPSDEILNNAMRGIATVNLDNELQRLRSTQLFERVVRKGNFNISYYIEGKVRKSDVYKSAPFQLIPKTIQDSSEARYTFTGFSQEGAMLSTGEGSGKKEQPIRWGQPFTIGGKTFVAEAKDSYFKPEAVYSAVWNPVRVTAQELLDKVDVGTSGTKTTIIELSIKIENLNRGIDVLNALAQEFRLSNVEELNRIAQNTIRFIDDRLAMVTEELKGVEGSLESYQGNARAYGLNEQSSQSFENTDNTSRTMNEIGVQQRVIEMVRQSLTTPGQGKMIPSTLGLNDKALIDLVTRYNELQLKKEREAPNVGEQSIILKDMNGQLAELKTSILENLGTLSKNLDLQRNSLQQQNSQYNQVLSSLPRKERMLQEIKRQQSIKEGLFLYLLQKREEAAISRTSQPSNYEQIDPAEGYGPVEPNKGTVYKFAFILGLVIPIGFIYLRGLLNEKVMTREDIIRKSALPIVGEISHISKAKSKALPALGRDLAGEQFRLMRSNLAFLQKGKSKQVVLVTSCSSGEGKSFISLNLAAILAKAGKKVALLEFDFRKPHDANYGLENGPGLTEYLSGNAGLQEIVQHFGELPNLHIYPAGAYVTDPGDLLISDEVGRLISGIREEYDAVVINSAPAGLVSDAQILGEYTDMVLYVVRQGFTTRKQLNFMEDLYMSHKFHNMCIVFNDVRTGMKYGYDGYGYGKNNAYYNGNGTVKVSFWKKMKKTVGIH